HGITMEVYEREDFVGRGGKSWANGKERAAGELEVFLGEDTTNTGIVGGVTSAGVVVIGGAGTESGFCPVDDTVLDITVEVDRVVTTEVLADLVVTVGTVVVELGGGGIAEASGIAVVVVGNVVDVGVG